MKTYYKRRVVIPHSEPGQVFAYQVTGNIISLIPVKPAREGVPIVKLGQAADGLWQFPSNMKITDEDIKRAIDQARL